MCNLVTKKSLKNLSQCLDLELFKYKLRVSCGGGETTKNQVNEEKS